MEMMFGYGRGYGNFPGVFGVPESEQKISSTRPKRPPNERAIYEGRKCFNLMLVKDKKLIRSNFLGLSFI